MSSLEYVRKVLQSHFPDHRLSSNSRSEIESLLHGVDTHGALYVRLDGQTLAVEQFPSHETEAVVIRNSAPGVPVQYRTPMLDVSIHMMSNSCTPPLQQLVHGTPIKTPNPLHLLSEFDIPELDTTLAAGEFSTTMASTTRKRSRFKSCAFNSPMFTPSGMGTNTNRAPLTPRRLDRCCSALRFWIGRLPSIPQPPGFTLNNRLKDETEHWEKPLRYTTEVFDEIHAKDVPAIIEK
eukprot:PhF_6_TR9467/c0_g1_i2/m.14787